MPRKTVFAPRLEPYDRLVKIYVTASQRHDLDQLVAELRVSRSALIRRAIEAGLPRVVTDARGARREGARPEARRSVSPAPVRHGPRSDGPVAEVWRTPAPGEAPEPPLDYPLPDLD